MSANIERESSNVLISWSGKQSHAIAIALHDWLPNVVREVKPWLSSEDISKGSVWATELIETLSACRLGIAVITPQNQTAAWVLFEAGCLFRAIEQNRVFTLLCGIDSPLTGPLGLFQATRLEREDIRKLVSSIDVAINGKSNPRLDVWFDRFYPDLMESTRKIIESHKHLSAEIGPSDSQMLKDILAGVQEIKRSTTNIATTVAHPSTAQSGGTVVFPPGIHVIRLSPIDSTFGDEFLVLDTGAGMTTAQSLAWAIEHYSDTVRPIVRGKRITDEHVSGWVVNTHIAGTSGLMRMARFGNEKSLELLQGKWKNLPLESIRISSPTIEIEYGGENRYDYKHDSVTFDGWDYSLLN